MSRQSFRIAVRKFGPFESAIAKQWAAFEAEAHTGLHLEAVPMDLHPLGESLASDDWDVHFVNTDWIASLAASGRVADLAPLLAADPPSQYPHGWAPSLLRLHTVEGAVLGLPYHDGPECLIYRKDLFEDAGLTPPRTWDELHRMARLLHRPHEGLSGTVFAAFRTATTPSTISASSCGRGAGELFDASGALRLDTPQAAEGLAFYARSSTIRMRSIRRRATSTP